MTSAALTFLAPGESLYAQIFWPTGANVQPRSTIVGGAILRRADPTGARAIVEIDDVLHLLPAAHLFLDSIAADRALAEAGAQAKGSRTAKPANEGVSTAMG
ncbi:hypothetical protein EPN42_04525 [bacterium]|nr:MAG: hypothetical protein EPN42_04525 [bacterium]